MTIAMGRSQQADRGWFDNLDDWLKRDRFVLLVGVAYYYSPPHFYLSVAGSLASHLSHLGILTV